MTDGSVVAGVCCVVVPGVTCTLTCTEDGVLAGTDASGAGKLVGTVFVGRTAVARGFDAPKTDISIVTT